MKNHINALPGYDARFSVEIVQYISKNAKLVISKVQHTCTIENSCYSDNSLKLKINSYLRGIFKENNLKRGSEVNDKTSSRTLKEPYYDVTILEIDMEQRIILFERRNVRKLIMNTSMRLVKCIMKNFLYIVHKITQITVSELNGMLHNFTRECWNMGVIRPCRL